MSRNGCKILILETSHAVMLCRVRFRSCEVVEYVENVKSVQYLLILQTFSFSTGSEFLRPQYIFCEKVICVN